MLLAGTTIESIMRKECAITATIKMEEQRNHGSVGTKNFMRTACVKTVT